MTLERKELMLMFYSCRANDLIYYLSDRNVLNSLITLSGPLLLQSPLFSPGFEKVKKITRNSYKARRLIAIPSGVEGLESYLN